MNEDYVSYEVAKLLKEKGFEDLCNRCYLNNNLYEIRCFNGADMLDGNFYAAPLLYDAQKWLRTKKGLHIEIIYMNGDYWLYEILTIPNHDLTGLSYRENVKYVSYEDALNAGIFEALRLI